MAKDNEDSTTYEHWLEINRDDLTGMWLTMGIVEKHEEGGDFKTFCKSQFDQSDNKYSPFAS